MTLTASRRTFDGFAYQIGIYPWSEELAAEIRALCTGFDLTVVERPPGVEYPPDWGEEGRYGF